MRADRYSHVTMQQAFPRKAFGLADHTQHVHQRVVLNRDVASPAALADERLLMSALADQRMVSNSLATLRAELNLLTDPVRAQLELPPELESILTALELAFPPESLNNSVVACQGRH